MELRWQPLIEARLPLAAAPSLHLGQARPVSHMAAPASRTTAWPSPSRHQQPPHAAMHRGFPEGVETLRANLGYNLRDQDVT